MRIPGIVLSLLVVILIFGCRQETIQADILIANGTVYNGKDTIPSQVSVAIKNDRIVYVGKAPDVTIEAAQTIDATGYIVCPGFIDPHTHADRDLIEPDKAHNRPFLMQGVTTVVVGSDGNSFFPSKKFITLYKDHGIGTNVALLFGHGTIREQVMGKSDTKATAEDITKMKRLAQQEMDAGTFGMSTGLFYAPGSYSEIDEVIALAKTVAQNKGIYDTHLRDEGSFTIGLVPAVKEAIEIGKQAKLPIHISHIKCLGADVWNESTTIIELIEEARNEGIELTANQYPYDASATGLKSAVVPRWAESGGKDSLFIRMNNPKLKERILKETLENIDRRGGPDKILMVKAEDSTFVGKNLLELAQMLKMSPEMAVYHALKTGYIRIASFNMQPEDISNFMRQEWVVTGSDGNSGHPRKYGTFPRKYTKYVKQEKIIDLASFINHSSSKTADIFRMEKRGALLKGYYADIIVFNPNTFNEKADYTNAFELAEGLEYSIINGNIAVHKGIPAKVLHGKVLKK